MLKFLVGCVFLLVLPAHAAPSCPTINDAEAYAQELSDAIGGRVQIRSALYAAQAEIKRLTEENAALKSQVEATKPPQLKQ